MLQSILLKSEIVMKKKIQITKELLKDSVFTIIILISAFVLNLLMQEIFDTRSLIPMVFVLGVFLVSLKTTGYFYGITASIISVLLVNYAFTYPYFAIDLISPECVMSAIVMLVVAILTGTLTTKIKEHEKIKAETKTEHMRANLLRAVSHDLRTPLTSVYGSSSAIIENYDDISREQKLRLLSEIQDDAQWLIRMVENLLSVTRLDSKDVKIKKCPTVLEELIDSVLVKFKKRCPRHEVDVQIPEEFLSIPMDPMLIEQVIVNLLENSVHHAEGMTKLSLIVEKNGENAVFRIIDDGCGFKEENLKSVLTGYFEKTSRPADGTRSNMGIGLSVCSAIITAHGGEISVKNLKPRGSEVSFTLKSEEQNEQ